MKIKIKKITRKEVETKYGKKVKLGLFDGEKWYGCWLNKGTQGYKEGDTVEGTITEREYNGKTYYDFEPPKAEEKVLEAQKGIEAKLDQIISMLKTFQIPVKKQPELPLESTIEEPDEGEDEVDKLLSEDIPF